MRVRIQLACGPRIAVHRNPRRRAALQMSVWTLQIAVFGYAMTLWKFGFDLGRLPEFAVESGWLSRWQLWGALALWAHASSLILRAYGEKPARATRQKPRPVVRMPSHPRPVEGLPGLHYRAG